MVRSSISIAATRRLIGAVLLGLLILIVVFGFAALIGIERAADQTLIQGAQAGDAAKLAALARIAADQSKANADRLAVLINIVFGPVAALVGSVIGFYFGSQRK